MGAMTFSPGDLNQKEVKIAKKKLKTNDLKKIFLKSFIAKYEIKIEIKKYRDQNKIIINQK